MKNIFLIFLMTACGVAEEAPNQLAPYEKAFSGGVVTQKYSREIKYGVFERGLWVKTDDEILLIINHPDFLDTAVNEKIRACILQKGSIDPVSNHRKWIFDRWQ